MDPSVRTAYSVTVELGDFTSADRFRRLSAAPRHGDAEILSVTAPAYPLLSLVLFRVAVPQNDDAAVSAEAAVCAALSHAGAVGAVVGVGPSPGERPSLQMLERHVAETAVRRGHGASGAAPWARSRSTSATTAPRQPEQRRL